MARRLPEILAPAGDHDSLHAALGAHADAVYFGLDEGLNARARATNFKAAELPALCDTIHRAGARAYLTLNTLVFEDELPVLEGLLRQAAAAGIDAVIVQDPAVALLARALAPTMEVHASTQMTVSSPEGAAFAQSLGITRVVAPRELSVKEVATFAAQSPIELEVFVHGALCMSWSGQCLTSEAWGGRSANRGQCAQSCRLPYQLVVDGAVKPLGDVQYLLSPLDLSGARAVPALVEAGVASLKIEGRLKGPAYVATAVEGYRRWRDAVGQGLAGDAAAQRALTEDLGRMAVAYSRGFSDGFLAGSDHQDLVEGRFPKHRGALLGEVVDVRPPWVRVRRASRVGTGGAALGDGAGAEGTVSAPLPAVAASSPHDARGVPVEAPVPVPGAGVGFDTGHPEAEEPGGPLFAVERTPDGYRLQFGRPGPDLASVRPGHRVWLSSDPRLTAQGAAASAEGARGVTGRIPARLEVSGQAGEPLRARLVALGPVGQGRAVEGATQELLAAAQGEGLGEKVLAEKLGALGGTPFRLEALATESLGRGLHVPVSALKVLRRSLAEALEAAVLAGRRHVVAPGSAVENVVSQARAAAAASSQGDATAPGAAGRHPGSTSAASSGAITAPGTASEPRNATVAAARATRGVRAAPPPRPARAGSTDSLLVPLVRTASQLEAVISLGLPEVELDFMELAGLGAAVKRAREKGLKVTVATTRVQKPGEEGVDGRLKALAPDGVLVRHWGGLVHFSRLPAAQRPKVHGDFSLNVTNSVTAHQLFALGCDSLTAAHDLDETQLAALLTAAPAERFTVVLHHHIATFHTEHCVYAHTLSHGRDFHTCGRPCEKHHLQLEDPKGHRHPVVVDWACRNTVFNAQAQSGAAALPRLKALGVRRFRCEFVWEDEATCAAVLDAYRALLSGALSAKELVRRIEVHEQFGVTAGTMRTMVEAR